MLALRATTAKSPPNSNGSPSKAAISIGELENLPERIHISLERRQSMRYGENPHQAAALYIPAGTIPSGLAGAKQLQGKELSYNNLVDLDAAWALVTEFHRPGVAIIKHNNPCGAAEQDLLVDAYLKALACDPISAFGGVIASIAVGRGHGRRTFQTFRGMHRGPGILTRPRWKNSQPRKICGCSKCSAANPFMKWI